MNGMTPRQSVFLCISPSFSPAVLFVLLFVVSLLTGCKQVKQTSVTINPVGGTSGQSGIPHRAKFSDVTAEAGLAFTQSHGGCGLHYFIEWVTPGVAFIDANNDGFLDVYFPQPKSLGKCPKQGGLRHRLYLNDGKGRFDLAPHALKNVDTAYGIAAAVGDYDNDGDADIYVACYGRNSLLRNRGNGTFEDITARAGVGLTGFSTGAVWFDYDKDGYLDLYVMRYCDWSVETDVACITTTGKQRDVCFPTTYGPVRHVLYHNNGDGTFSNSTHRAGMSQQPGRGLGVAAADFNQDGNIDLFVANDLGPNFLYLNQGNSTFQEVAVQRNAAFGLTGQAQGNMGVAVGDYDEDSDLDILVTTFADEPYTLYRNDGEIFTDVSTEAGITHATLSSLGFGTAFVDVQNAGKLDLFFANGHVSPIIHLRQQNQTYKQKNQLLLNDGSGKYVEAADALPPDDVRVHRAACFGDVNNDGRVDILVTSNNGRPTLLKNESEGGNWLVLKLVNHHGCVTPIGTRCTATIEDKKRVRVVLGGGSYGGESDHRVHFGLGDAVKVEKLEIRWPSGRVQLLENVTSNQVLVVHEPKKEN